MTTPRLLSERYELGDTLGYGGMSEVHKGRDVRLSRDVAVKVLRADLARDPQFQIRFRREAQNAAALNHPAIVAVYDTGETESEFGTLPYIVMEFVDGQTLREIVKTSGPMSQQRVMEVMADVCAALDFSHRHGIIHRDVKPANVMITKSGAVKVMDFGIARALSDSQNMTQTAAVIGTAQYLSPEQARGEPVDARSDVYAAGCVLFELLTGEPPFSGDSPVAVAYQHVREDVRQPSEVNPEVPAELDAIVLKAMSKNPANRYQSAAEMRSDLVRVLRGQRPLAPQVMTEEERTALLHGGASATAGAAHRLSSPTGPTRHAAPPTWASEETGARTGKMIGIGVGVVAMLAIIVFVITRIYGGTVTAPQKAIPDVANQSQQMASQTLNIAGFKPNIVPQGSPSVPIGLAISTNPPANTQWTVGGAVSILISTGPQPVPDLTGKTQADASQILQANGYTLAAQVKSQGTSDQTQIGMVLNQEPKPGSKLKPGGAVTVYLGVLGTPIPNLIGQDVAAAMQKLQQLQLVGSETQVDGPGPVNSVLSSSPAAGTLATAGSTVTLKTSLGNEVKMPNLLGQTKKQAKQTMQDAGFYNNPNFYNQGSSDSSDDNQTVIQQSVKPGTNVDPNSNVDVYLGDGNNSGNNNSGNNNSGNNPPSGNNGFGNGFGSNGGN
jgi:serine/threonine protein kinase/beta-lactam-binding protein with PASTA domain